MKEEIIEYCGYCYRITDNLIKVFLRDGLHSWQGPMLICKQCKDYLKGMFKYAE